MTSQATQARPRPQLAHSSQDENRIRPHIWPFLISTVIYAAVTGVLLVAAYRAADAHFVYPLDDTYINMAMAKNFALHAVWGINQYQFSSSTSSPVFVLLLAAMYRLFGVSEFTPLLLSWIFGLASIYLASRILGQYLNEATSAIALVAITLFTPLFAIGILGMEHTLDVFLVLVFLALLMSQAHKISLALATALMVGTRYEGLFLVVAAVAALLMARKPLRSLLITVAAAVPVVFYAVFSAFHGGYWLPNSISLKGVPIHQVGLAARFHAMLHLALSNSVHAPSLVFLLVGIAACIPRLRRRETTLLALGTTVVGAGLLHLFLASVGYVFRYEDYLIAAGVLVATCMIGQLLKHERKVPLAAVLLLFCSGAFLLGRSIQAATLMPKYSRFIFLQQYQTAKFLGLYYPDSAVAANDVGLISFRNPIHCVDLVGLADRDVFVAKREGRYSTEELNSIVSAEGVRIAVIYDTWFVPRPRIFWQGPSIPSTWVRVARWKVPAVPDLGHDIVSFYAVRPEDAETLRAHLGQFEPNLPSAVTLLP
jgi:hypothetical protein